MRCGACIGFRASIRSRQVPGWWSRSHQGLTLPVNFTAAEGNNSGFSARTLLNSFDTQHLYFLLARTEACRSGEYCIACFGRPVVVALLFVQAITCLSINRPSCIPNVVSHVVVVVFLQLRPDFFSPIAGSPAAGAGRASGDPPRQARQDSGVAQVAPGAHRVAKGGAAADGDATDGVVAGTDGGDGGDEVPGGGGADGVVRARRIRGMHAA